MKKWSIYISLVVLLAGCSTATRYRIARVLFDGVPPLSSDNLEEKMGSEAAEGEKQWETLSSKPSSPSFYSHYPFAERSCDSCHDPQGSNSLMEEGNDLCLTCHDEILAEAKVIHFPAEEDCLICHNPHRSKNARLLNKPMEVLCFDCHDQDDVEELHGEIMPCMSCHAPHRSEEDFLLKNE